MSSSTSLRSASLPNAIEAYFKPILGLPCWNAKPGRGSFLTMEFGEPYLEIREPVEAAPHASDQVKRLLARRGVYVHGEWHLWIYCCAWKVFTGEELIGDSDLQGSTKERIIPAAAELDGQRLMRVEVDPARGTSVFHFDLGSRLETEPYEDDSEQWMLYQPNGCVLVYRSDGWYSDAPGNQKDKERHWRPVLSIVPGGARTIPDES